MAPTARKIGIVRRSGRSTFKSGTRSPSALLKIKCAYGAQNWHRPTERPIHLILRRFQNRHDLGLNWLSGHFDIFFCDVNIDFGTDTEFAFDVNAGLDGEGDAGNEVA